MSTPGAAKLVKNYPMGPTMWLSRHHSPDVQKSLHLLLKSTTVHVLLSRWNHQPRHGSAYTTLKNQYSRGLLHAPLLQINAIVEEETFMIQECSFHSNNCSIVCIYIYIYNKTLYREVCTYLSCIHWGIRKLNMWSAEAMAWEWGGGGGGWGEVGWWVVGRTVDVSSSH